MANNYLEFSEVIPHLTCEEQAWLYDQLEEILVIDGVEYSANEIPEELQGVEPQWSGCLAYRDMQDYDADFGEGAGFEWEFFDGDDSPSSRGRRLWLYAIESAALDRLAHLIRKFLAKFRPNDVWSLTYATYCSKPRVGEFSGGALVVTAAEIKSFDAYDFVEQQTTPQKEHPTYSLNVGGPQLRAQRALLLKLLSRTDTDEKQLLEGLIALTDAIADQAHDRHGLDCLLDETDQACACELPGPFCCGAPGILAHLENGRLAADAKVERCDLCCRYPSDEAALEKLQDLGYGPL